MSRSVAGKFVFFILTFKILFHIFINTIFIYILIKLKDLKIAIRAAGEHKQRITIHVTIDGLRLRDEKTGVNINFKLFFVIKL